VTVIRINKANEGCINVVQIVHDEIQYRSAPLDDVSYNLVRLALMKKEV